jgi:hypothetical protein
LGSGGLLLLLLQQQRHRQSASKAKEIMMTINQTNCGSWIGSDGCCTGGGFGGRDDGRLGGGVGGGVGGMEGGSYTTAAIRGRVMKDVPAH